MRKRDSSAGTVLVVGDVGPEGVIEARLSETGLATDSAADVLDALDRLDARRYACVLLADSDRDHVESVDRLRTAGHTLPVVAVVDGSIPDTSDVDAVAPASDPAAVAARVAAAVETHRRSLERTERRRVRRAVEAARDAALDAEETTAALETLCRTLVDAGAYSLAWVGERDGESTTLEPVAAAGLPLAHLGAVPVGPNADSLASRAVDTGTTVVDTEGKRPTFAVPLGEPAAAVLHVSGRRVGGDTAGERQVLASLGTALCPLFSADDTGAPEADGLRVLGDTLSHELGNQLDIAVTHLELARERGDESHFEHVDAALDRMGDLAADARHLATDEPATEPVDIADAADEAWAAVGTDDATLEYADTGIVEADPDLLVLLLENLLRNAVDHGGPGVRIRVGTTDEGFAVADDGPGIPPEDRERVLEWGYSTDGTGVGLGIVALVAERHGWSVAVTESQAGGARFEFS